LIKNCESPYTASKIGGEALTQAYMRCYGIDFMIFRFSNVYGMYDDSDRVVPLFVKLTKEGKNLTVFGKDKLLDFVYIDVSISGIIECIESFDRAKNETYNIADGRSETIIRVAELIQENMGSKTEIKIEKSRTGEVIKFIADISNAKDRLKFEPQIGLDEGIKKTVDWYLKNLY